MKAAGTHQRVSDDVSANGVNRVNREQHGDRPRGESVGRASQSAGQVWRNIGSLRALLARADRELSREPGAYVAVAVVHGDKREEQAGRWGWAGSRDAGGQVAGHGNRLAPGDRGLRVRVHREGGALVGSTLLRRTTPTETAPERAVRANAAAAHELATDGHDRLAAVEAKLTRVLALLATQGEEITTLKRTISEMGPVPQRMNNFHKRLDDLEAAAHRHPEDAEDGDGDGAETEEEEDRDDDDLYGEDDE